VSKFHVVPIDNSDYNELAAKILEEEAKRVRNEDKCVSGLGVIITYSNGAVATAFRGPNYIHLLGGLSILQERLIGEFRHDG
jgi:hypothetical protein